MRRPKTDLEKLAAELERLGGGESPPRGIIDSEKWLEDYADKTAERAEEAFRQVETEESNRIEAEDAAKVKMLGELKEADTKEIEELDETIPGIPPGKEPEKTLRWRRWWARIQTWIGWVSLICLGGFAVEPFIPLDWSNGIRWAAALFVALGFIPASYAIERVFDLVQSRRLLAALFFIASLSGLAAAVDWELLRGTILIHDLQEEDADEGGDNPQSPNNKAGARLSQARRPPQRLSGAGSVVIGIEILPHGDQTNPTHRPKFASRPR